MKKTKYTRKEIRDARREIYAAAGRRPVAWIKVWLLLGASYAALFALLALALYWAEDSRTTVFYEFLDIADSSAIQEHYRAEGFIEPVGTVGLPYARVLTSRKDWGFGFGSGFGVRVGEVLSVEVDLHDLVLVSGEFEIDGKLYPMTTFQTWPDVSSLMVDPEAARIPEKRAHSMLAGVALHVRSVEGLDDVADAITTAEDAGSGRPMSPIIWIALVAFGMMIAMVSLAKACMRIIERSVIEQYIEHGDIE